jgi:hypothetical protein
MKLPALLVPRLRHPLQPPFLPRAFGTDSLDAVHVASPPRADTAIILSSSSNADR